MSSPGFGPSRATADPNRSLMVAGALGAIVAARPGRRLIDRSPGRGVAPQFALVVGVREIEHVVDAPGDRIERSARLDALERKPVVLNEAQDSAAVTIAVTNASMARCLI